MAGALWDVSVTPPTLPKRHRLTSVRALAHRIPVRACWWAGWTGFMVGVLLGGVLLEGARRRALSGEGLENRGGESTSTILARSKSGADGPGVDL